MSSEEVIMLEKLDELIEVWKESQPNFDCFPRLTDEMIEAWNKQVNRGL